MIQTIFSSTAPWPYHKTMRALIPRKPIWTPRRGPKLTAQQVLDIRAKDAAGVAKKSLEIEYGVTWETLNNVLKMKGAYAAPKQ